MRFGPISVEDADGTILAHGVRSGDLRFSKGRILSAGDIAALRDAGIDSVVAARLDPGDVGEDDAARRIAGSMRGSGFDVRAPSTGRVNLHAANAGVFTVAAALVNALNGINPAITFATLRDHVAVAAGQMVATVKIIPFAVAGELVEKAEAICAASEIMNVHEFAPRRAGLIQTTLSGTKPKVLDKTERVTAARLARSGSGISVYSRCDHDTDALAQAIGDVAGDSNLIIVFGASATSDADDVIPAAIRKAGGEIKHVGMPVDPGNLITLGELDGTPVIGAPGCARSPKENGFDWVLDRIIADIAVSGSDMEMMGVGGLLGEIPVRPRPREIEMNKTELKLFPILLAAGRSSRMGGPNKLLATFGGVPLVRRSAATVVEAGLGKAVVVTGHQQARIEGALSGLDVRPVHNPDFASGLSGSLKAGVHALPNDADGALVMLADMPGVSASDLKAMADAFRASGGGSIIRATHSGKRGNPVILPKSVFPMMETIEGDTGARQIVESGSTPVVDVEIGSAASVDVDTPEMMKAAGGLVDPDNG